MAGAGRSLHRGSTLVLSLAMIVIGVAMVVSTLVRGGGPLALGVLLGVGFVGAGAARIFLLGRG